jgi:hypothetical protein
MPKARGAARRAYEFGHGAIEHRGGPVETDTQQRQERDRAGERQRQHGDDADGRQPYRQQHGVEKPEAGAQISATSFPAAPPRNSKDKALPMLAIEASLALSRKGRKVKQPLRPALSIIAIAKSRRKPRRGGISGGLGAVRGEAAAALPRCGALGRPGARASTRAAQTVPRPQRRAPGHGAQQQRRQQGHRHLAEIAGEVVDAKGGARAPTGKDGRYQARADGVLHAAPIPPKTRIVSKPARPREAPASRKDTADTEVPAASSKTGPQRSARSAAGICSAAITPV